MNSPGHTEWIDKKTTKNECYNLILTAFHSKFTAFKITSSKEKEEFRKTEIPKKPTLFISGFGCTHATCAYESLFHESLS